MWNIEHSIFKGHSNARSILGFGKNVVIYSLATGLFCSTQPPVCHTIRRMSERQAKNVTAVVSDVAIVGSGPAGLSLAGILEQKGISYVVYEKYGRDTTPLGGCLDMHKGSGHTAFEQAGCYAEFRKYGRLGPATIHQVWDYAGNQPFAWGEGVDSPELDRFQIKKALLTVVPDEKIRWNTGVTEAKRGPDGMVVLHLTDGSMASGFKLVVGADGTWSKVRPLVSDNLLLPPAGLCTHVVTFARLRQHYRSIQE